jgi:hypothetical protein
VLCHALYRGFAIWLCAAVLQQADQPQQAHSTELKDAVTLATQFNTCGREGGMSRKQVAVRVTEEQYEALMKLAKDRRWTMQTLLEVMIEKFLAQKNQPSGNGK